MIRAAMRACAVVVIALACAAGRSPPDADLLRSDLPLWGNDAVEGELWPRPFRTADSFGCRHRIKLGDWNADGYRGDDEWIRFDNYGAVHCALIERRAYVREQLQHRFSDYAWLVSLGEADGRNGRVELWALQSGVRTGSSYTLLASKPKKDPIDAFDVLQVECPKDRVRAAPALDIWLTRYCAINSRDELIALARRMVRRPPAAELTFVSEVKGE